MKFAVKEGGQFRDADFETGFFTNLASGGDGGRLANVRPAAGKRPAAVLNFADEKNLAIAERSDTHVDLGSGVARLLGKEVLDRSGAGEGGACAHHFSGNVADFVVAVDIEFVFGIGQAGLRDSLKTPSPDEPLWNRHASILAAERGADKLREELRCRRT